MVAAPVGFQCPECVAGAAARTRQATTPAGGTPISRPAVTYTLIGVNAAIFLAQFAIGINVVAGDWGMWPVGIAIGGEWWRLVTAAFLHGSFLHIAFNMYVLAALGGGVASYAFSDIRTVSVGASGAIFGLMGALVVAGRRLRYDITQVLILLAINVVIGFFAPGVDWRAHLGGLVTGAVVAAILVLPARRHRTAIQVSGLLAVVLALAAIAAWRTAQISELLAPLGDFAV
jgi:membrane associated rhomboid family serine protease